MLKNNSKASSLKQENEIAKLLGGKVQSNSGGTRFGGGDVHTASFFIEAKTCTTDKESFSVKKEWIKKMQEQAFEQRKRYSTLAFRFGPDQEDYFVIDRNLMKLLVEYIEEDNK